MTEEVIELKEYKISRQALQSIVRLAISEIEGVSLFGGILSTLSEHLGKLTRGKSLNIEVSENEGEIGVKLVVEYGLNIPEIAHQVQFKIKAAVESMTGLKVRNVNILVAGINFHLPKEE